MSRRHTISLWRAWWKSHRSLSGDVATAPRMIGTEKSNLKPTYSYKKGMK